MKRFLLIVLFHTILFLPARATHNRAGEITYKQTGELTFEITITTYTYTLSPADRDELPVEWGDNSSSIAQRYEEVLLPDYYKRNKYSATHTYPGPGVYEIVVEDPNRNFGVGNIPNSVNVVFAIKTIIQINPDIGQNSTPILLYAPIDKAALHQVFIHNPLAFDPDGDSLSYKLTTCLSEGGEPIQDYSLPPYDNAFYVDSVSGDLVWDSPTVPGIYNVAMLIEEWRFGIKIGNIERDMQIEVKETDNRAPEIKAVDDLCIEAGQTVDLVVECSDPDGDELVVEALGGPFIVDENPASFTPLISTGGTYKYRFTWHTACSHVHEQAYQVLFKATDKGNDVNLVDLESIKITVVAPAPKNLALEPSNKTMKLSWSPSVCTQAVAYDIYRKIGGYNFIPDECETGIPTYTGFEKIATNNSWDDTVFVDNNQGLGLTQGLEYCYRIYAVFHDGAKSYASEEVCDYLQNGIPVITNVDITSTSESIGSIYLAWSKPKELDTLQADGPFKYLIYRSEGLWGENLSLIDSLYQNGLDDTIYNDTGINTRDTSWSYKVELWNDSPGNRFLVGSPQIASSQYLQIIPGDNQLILQINRNVPWIDSVYVFYKQNSTSMLFDSIGTNAEGEFIDQDLKNGTSYCYKVLSVGYYNSPSILFPLYNNSQERCAVPIDTTPPCQPDLQVESKCDQFTNLLNWTNPNNYCADDVIGYNIYYTPNYNEPMKLLTHIDTSAITSYHHVLADSSFSLAACYSVSAIDSFFNESSSTERVCVDACFDYQLPNVFTPNNDGKLDVLHPLPYYAVEKIDLKIYDRWGVLVFTTEDPDINWDGTFSENNKKVASGVYYYTCDVYTHRLTGLEHTTLVGFIHVYADKSLPQSNN